MNTNETYPSIGFIGQGFIGKQLADNFEHRGFDTVRYALEPAYADNIDAIRDCSVVFVAVPTPTTPTGFDDSVLREVMYLIAPGTIVVIKSTILPGTTRELQFVHEDLVLLHSPEFLREKYAQVDTDTPPRTIIGKPEETERHQDAAEMVLALLPESPCQLICTSDESELIKYGGNGFLMLKVVYMNLLYDLASQLSADYDVIAGAMAADPRIGESHMQVIDTSGHSGAKAGRGAGGHCFPKDWAASRELVEKVLPEDVLAQTMISAVEQKNLHLLRQSIKDLDLVEAIYGTEVLQRR
jgi:UDPglucose 6-dehydrogenase